MNHIVEHALPEATEYVSHLELFMPAPVHICTLNFSP